MYGTIVTKNTCWLESGRQMAQAKNKAIGISREELDYSSPEPMYVKLADMFRTKIEQEVFKIGSLLPTEMAICGEFGVSRSTVQKALSVLEDEGIVIRKRGKGTFVVKPKLKRGLSNLYNFSAEMRMLGLKPHSEVISFDVAKPSFRVAQQLGLNMDESVYRIVRLRMANDVPMLLETAYIPQKYCPRLTKESLSDSLYAMVMEYTGAQPVEAVETYDVTLITDQQAKQLQCPVGSPAFKIERVSTDSMGNVFEAGTIIAPGARNRYQITMHKDAVSVARKID